MAPYPEMKRRRFPVKWLVLLGVAGAAIYFGPKLFKGGEAGGPGGMPPGGAMPASVATVISEPVVTWNEFSGRIEAVNMAEIRPRVSGQITAIHFKDGEEVKKGQSLFTIDPRPYEAAYISAKGAYAQAQASFARAGKLVKSKAISQAEFETAQSGYQQALGNYKLAEVNLDYTSVRAPISGKISRAEITVGNNVDAGPGAPLLASIVMVSPVYASFELDEKTYLSTIQGVPTAKLKTIPVEVGVGNDAGTPIKASIHSFDNQIAAGSGTIRVRATIPNKDGALVPGLFAKVRIGSADATPAILINPVAVSTDQNKKFVLAIGADSKAEYREVTLGSMSGGLQIITSGLKEGDQIVVGGIQRLKPGAAVQPIPTDMETLKPIGGETPPPEGAAPPAPPTEAAK